MGWDACTIKLRNTGKCCCSSCFNYATHHQHAWDRVYPGKLISEVFPAAAAGRVDSEADGA
jgi:hypothetical protein